MKKILHVALFLMISFCFAGCNSVPETVFVPVDKESTIGRLSYKHPSEWKTEKVDSNTINHISGEKFVITSGYFEGIYKSEEDIDLFVGGIADEISNIQDYSVDGYKGKRFYTSYEDDEGVFLGECIALAIENDIATVYVLGSGDSFEKYKQVANDSFSSIRIIEKKNSTNSNESIKKEDTEKTTPKEEPAKKEPTTTPGQSNALKAAKNYLNVMPFSYSGLIEQLEYEQYSTEDATYAADNCGADWNIQAAKSAKNYIDLMPFSRDGLIDQLIYEGYTYEQAVHGVDSVGL